MNFNLKLSLVAGSASVCISLNALAVPFNSFDPKSMAMGGAGVAVANPGSSVFFNPALMSIASKSDDFALVVPVIGARAYDPDDFVDAVDNFDDSVVSDLDNAISQNNFAIRNNSVNPVDLRNTVNAIDAVNQEVLTLSDRPMEAELGGGVVLAIPSDSFGLALHASASANFSGVMVYADADTVTNLTQDVNSLAQCYEDANPAFSGNLAAFTDCVTTPAKFNFVTVTDSDNDPTTVPDIEINFTAESTGTVESDIKSKVNVLGVAIAEVGLTLSREMTLMDKPVAIGITPKVVNVTVFDYEVNADNADVDNVSGDDYSVDYSDFNMDIGFAMDHRNGWRSGLVIKNVVAQDYDAMNFDTNLGVKVSTGRILSIKPQARIGVSHTNDWSTLALDLDLTENDSVGIIGDSSRYAALGLELNALDWAQIRLGYRADMVNSDRSVASAGLGLSPFGVVHIDLAVAGNENEVGASFQLGFRF